MAKRWLALATVMVAGGVVLLTAGVRSSLQQARRATLDDVSRAPSHAAYESGLVRFDGELVSLDHALATGGLEPSRRAFRRARAAYKRVELFVEYYGNGTMRELNGVPMAKAEDEDPETPLAPVGLQMVEAALFPGSDSATIRGTRRYIGYMHTAVVALRRAGADTMPGDAYLFDAMRQEIARVATLGIVGFDATASGDAIVESADALTGVQEALQPYRTNPRAAASLASFDGELASAVAYLHASPSFETFDRLTFIARHAGPLAHRLADVQRSLGIGAPARPRAWSSRAASIYDRDAFDPVFFAATDAPRATPDLVALGRDLFFEPALSPTNSRSCASCHLPSRAFTDGRARAELLAGHRTGRPVRNTPTLLNAALQPTLFADGRVRTLEDQATDVIGNATEMGGSLTGAAATLRTRPAYVSKFARAFSAAPDTALSGRTLRLALAAYVRSLVSLDSRFDRAVRGDSGALTREERLGFNLFMGKAGCGTCHFAPLFHGATPPMLVESEPEVIGVPERPTGRHARIDPDSGRFNVRRIDQHLHAFRTPTLRNVALTAPYMHNGVYRRLEEVVDFYDAGGGHGIGARLEHQTLPPDSLHLSRREKRAIVAFMRTLTDNTIH